MCLFFALWASIASILLLKGVFWITHPTLNLDIQLIIQLQPTFLIILRLVEDVCISFGTCNGFYENLASLAKGILVFLVLLGLTVVFIVKLTCLGRYRAIFLINWLILSRIGETVSVDHIGADVFAAAQGKHLLIHMLLVKLWVWGQVGRIELQVEIRCIFITICIL